MKKKGAALLVVIIIMMLTFFLATIMIEASIKNLRVSKDTKESTNAYYCAESGVYDAINYIELMAVTGSFNASYYGYDIPIHNLYSIGENNGNTNLYLFGDLAASYVASLRLININTITTKTTYTCTINSKGTYNNQNYLINSTVDITYDTSNGKCKYVFKSKLSWKS